MKIKVSEASGVVLDWLVALAEEVSTNLSPTGFLIYSDKSIQTGPQGRVYQPSSAWEHGGPIVEKANITIIRADDTYGTDDRGNCNSVRIPRWFAECSQWVGHSICTSYESENMEPTFMISEDGMYGPTPLIAAMRCYVTSKLGMEVEVPEELLK